MSYNETVMGKLDLEKNGLLETVNANIEKYRKGNFAVTVLDTDGKPLPDAQVTFTLKKHAFKFGSTAFLADVFKDKTLQTQYEERFARLFNQAVMAFYWRDDEPEEGTLRFGKGSPYIYRRPPADEALEFCQRVGCEPKGHNMLWQNPDIGIPTWWPADNTARTKTIRRRIEQLAARYADSIPTWDVTNECTHAPGRDRMPPDYDTTAWLTATRLFPDCHLILNDYWGYFDEYRGVMSQTYLQAQKLMAQGARVDGVGIQYHLFTNKEDLPTQAKHGCKMDARHMLNMLDNYATLGTALHISEITVPSYSNTPESLTLQAEMVENLYRLWFSHPAVASIVWWNLADGYAYVSGKSNEDYYGGGLLYHDLTEKPAYTVLDRLINNEWHTEAATQTDAAGHTAFSGFYGDYTVTVTTGGKQVEKTVTFGKDAAPHTVQL